MFLSLPLESTPYCIVVLFFFNLHVRVVKLDYVALKFGQAKKYPSQV